MEPKQLGRDSSVEYKYDCVIGCAMDTWWGDVKSYERFFNVDYVYKKKKKFTEYVSRTSELNDLCARRHADNNLRVQVV